MELPYFAYMTSKGTKVCILLKGKEFLGVWSNLKSCVTQYREIDGSFPSYGKIARLAAKGRKKGIITFLDRNKLEYSVLFLVVK